MILQTTRDSSTKMQDSHVDIQNSLRNPRMSTQRNKDDEADKIGGASQVKAPLLLNIIRDLFTQIGRSQYSPLLSRTKSERKMVYVTKKSVRAI